MSWHPDNPWSEDHRAKLERVGDRLTDADGGVAIAAALGEIDRLDAEVQLLAELADEATPHLRTLGTPEARDLIARINAALGATP